MRASTVRRVFFFVFHTRPRFGRPVLRASGRLIAAAEPDPARDRVRAYILIIAGVEVFFFFSSTSVLVGRRRKYRKKKKRTDRTEAITTLLFHMYFTIGARRRSDTSGFYVATVVPCAWPGPVCVYGYMWPRMVYVIGTI